MSLPMPQDSSHFNGYSPSPTPPPTEQPGTHTRRIPAIHFLLFAATLVTTSLAGAFQQGANPLVDPQPIVQGLPFAITLLSILLFHEMGHYFLARHHGVRATLPYFIPGPPILIGTFG